MYLHVLMCCTWPQALSLDVRKFVIIIRLNHHYETNVMIFTSRELLCFVCAHKLTVMCLLYEMYKMNRHPSTRVVQCTLQMKLHVVLGVHSKAFG